jgi:hypothetical protein
LAERDKPNAEIQEILYKQTDVCGIKVTSIEIKDLDINGIMVCARSPGRPRRSGCGAPR